MEKMPFIAFAWLLLGYVLALIAGGYVAAFFFG